MKRVCFCLSLGLLWAIACLSAAAQEVEPAPALGGAIPLTAQQIAELTKPAPAHLAPAAGFTVDTQDRNAVLAFYHEVFLASQDYAEGINWTGNTAACDPGDIDPGFREDTRRRINYYRAMAGLPADVTFHPFKNAKAQAAALIFAANQTLTHFPIDQLPGGSCLSADGDEAARNSNIALGTFGAGSIDAYIRDSGDNNRAVGHRRWLLYPSAVEMGSGSIPPGVHGSAANAVWVIGNFGPRPAGPEFVSWPPPGYVPHNLIYPRWSFSHPNASFVGATVTMTENGAPRSLVYEPVADGFGDSTLVWVPTGLDTSIPDPDRIYEVTLNNVTVNGTPRSFQYTVVAMDPYRLTDEMVLTGPPQPWTGADNLYQFNPVSQATEYELRIARLAPVEVSQGAEANPAPDVVESISGGYSLYSSGLRRTGSRSFHMAFATFSDNDQSFAIDRDLVPASGAQWTYYSRFRFAGLTSRLSAEVSTGSGLEWQVLSSRPGNGATSSSGWEPAWVPTTVSLAAFAGQPVRLRLRYHYEPFTSVFLGTSDSYGVFVDDISVTGVEALTNLVLQPVPGGASNLVFRPPTPDVYVLQIRPRVAGQWFAFGPMKIVAGQEGPPSAVLLTGVYRIESGEVVIEFEVIYPTSATFHLWRAPDADGPYALDTAAAFETVVPGSRYRVAATAGTGRQFLRVQMD